MDKIFKTKSLNNRCSRNDCSNIRMSYTYIYWRFSLFIFDDKVDCAFIVHSFGKDASVATDLVLDHRTSGPMVPGPKS